MLKNKKAILIAVLMVFFIFKIQNIMIGIANALNVCATSIIPSLFVFMVFADILTSLVLNELSQISFKTLVFTLGTVCGFPVGAAVCDRLCENKIISPGEAKKIIPYCNNASPGFILGVVGTVFFENKKIGVIILASQFLSSAIPLMFIKTKSTKEFLKSPPILILDLFCNSLEKATYSILKVCATLCFFSAIIELLKSFSLHFASVFLEISNGTQYCAKLFQIHPYISVGLCGFCCGFSGICVLIQILSVTKSFKVPFLSLFVSKLFQGALCGVISLVSFYLFF